MATTNDVGCEAIDSNVSKLVQNAKFIGEFVGSIVKFSNTLLEIITSAVDDWVVAFRKLELKKTTTTEWARKLYGELGEMTASSIKYLDDVANFIQHVQNKDWQNSVMQSLKQSTRKFGSLSDYTSRLKTNLDRAADSHRRFFQTLVTVMESLQKVLNGCSINLSETEIEKARAQARKVLFIGGTLSWGVATGVGIALTDRDHELFPVFVLVAVAGTGLGLTAFGYAHHAAKKCDILSVKIHALKDHVAKMIKSVSSINHEVTEVDILLCSSSKHVSDLCTFVEDNSACSSISHDYLLDILKILFEKFDAAGTMCSDYKESLQGKKDILHADMDNLFGKFD